MKEFNSEWYKEHYLTEPNGGLYQEDLEKEWIKTINKNQDKILFEGELNINSMTHFQTIIPKVDLKYVQSLIATPKGTEFVYKFYEDKVEIFAKYSVGGDSKYTIRFFSWSEKSEEELKAFIMEEDDMMDDFFEMYKEENKENFIKFLNEIITEAWIKYIRNENK